jgi:hypothetical protein
VRLSFVRGEHRPGRDLLSMTNVPTDRACAAAMPWRRLSAVGRSVAVKHSSTCGAARRGAAATLAHSLKAARELWTVAQTAAMDCAEACASDGHATCMKRRRLPGQSAAAAQASEDTPIRSAAVSPCSRRAHALSHAACCEP